MIRQYTKRISIKERQRHIAVGEMWCPRCKAFKTFGCFNMDKYKPLGISTTCRDCLNKRRREIRDKGQDQKYRKRIQSMAKPSIESKRCARCGLIKSGSDFSVDSGRIDGLKPYCKTCSNEEKKSYNISHRESRHEYEKEYRKAHPRSTAKRQHVRRARKRGNGGTCTTDQINLLIKYYSPDGKCLSCGERRELVIDHVIPIKNGGTSNIYNMQPLCQSCNRKKFINEIDYRPDGGEYAYKLFNEALIK